MDRLFDRLLTYLGPEPQPTCNDGSDVGSNGDANGGSNDGSNAAEGAADWTPFADPSPFEDAAAAAAIPADGAIGGPAAAPSVNPLEDAVPKDHKSTPVMFLHGVGGLWLYLEMLKHVIALGHPVIVVEYKHVAMRLR